MAVKLNVPTTSDGERADKFLAQHCTDISRSRLQESFALGRVFRNGQAIAKSARLEKGDVVAFELPEAAPTAIEAVAGGDLKVLFEDDDVLVLDKGPGLVMHPGHGTGDDTLVHFALHHTGGKLSRLGGERRPGVVHRLDKDTTGALVLAKSDRAYLALTRQFAEREVAKEYLALVQGVPTLRSGIVREPIGRHPTVRVRMAVVPGTRGKAARTDWQVEEIFGKRAALIRCWPQTGRTHQIRVHLAHLGHPLLADRIYGWRPGRVGEPLAPRVMLHAALLSFPHPADERPMEFRAPLPEDFARIAAELRASAGEEPRRHAKA